MEKTKEIVKVVNLHAGYTYPILKGVNTIFYKNEIKFIMGESGGGKSTLLKAIIGLVKVYQGEIYINGENFLEASYEKRKNMLKRIGFMFQSGALISSYPIWENVALPLIINTDFPIDLIKDIVYSKLKLVKLEKAFYKLPGELSGGMIKRAAIARAIIDEPEILFCDEPTAGLDPLTAAELDDIILSLKETLKIGIIIVSHEIESIIRIGDKILFLQKGKDVFDGTLKEAKEKGPEELKRYFELIK